MSTARTGAKGHPPTIKIKPAPKLTEQQKFEKLWASEEYRETPSGEDPSQIFLSQAKMLPDSTVVDFGCGAGLGGLMIALMGKAVVTLVDFAENALDEDVQNATVTQPERISWLQADLTKPIPVTAAYGYCVNVLEQIPPDELDAALSNILAAANHVFFQISTEKDDAGLNLSVHSYSWWVKKLRQHDCTIHWSQNYEGSSCHIYGSFWVPKEEVVLEGKVNTDDETAEANMRENAKTEYQLIHPHILQDTEVMLLCGGPSLNDYTDEIIKLRAEGMPMITTNGTYNWAIANGMTPSMQLIIDGREFNKRFVRPMVDDCKYMIASQCHPAVFEGLPLDRTYIWHVGLASEMEKVLDELYELWFPCPGGSTVTLRGLCLLRMLGFHKIHMYGFDSCYRADAHHAYEQPENNYKSGAVPISVGGKVFWCDGWMYSQAREFMDLVKVFGDEFELNVKGDGLIAHIIKTGAALGALEEDEE